MNPTGSSDRNIGELEQYGKEKAEAIDYDSPNTRESGEDGGFILYKGIADSLGCIVGCTAAMRSLVRRPRVRRRQAIARVGTAWWIERGLQNKLGSCGRKVVYRVSFANRASQPPATRRRRL